MIWPLFAIFGVSLLIEVYADFLSLLLCGGAVILVWMGVRTIRNADKPIVADGRLSKSGMWAGFVAGFMIIIGNPKAIRFYMGVFLNFFDINNVTGLDIAVICAISGLVLFAGEHPVRTVDRPHPSAPVFGGIRSTNQPEFRLGIGCGWCSNRFDMIAS
ncbi:MAG: LysE family transporter [Paracoccaceae bacterium]